MTEHKKKKKKKKISFDRKYEINFIVILVHYL